MQAVVEELSAMMAGPVLPEFLQQMDPVNTAGLSHLPDAGLLLQALPFRN